MKKIKKTIHVYSEGKYTGLPCTNNVWLAIFKYYLKSWKEILIWDRQ